MSHLVVSLVASCLTVPHFVFCDLDISEMCFVDVSSVWACLLATGNEMEAVCDGDN